MSGKRVIVFLIFLLMMSTTLESKSVMVIEKGDLILSQYEEHEDILIQSDSDFVVQGWPGNGSEQNPFTISGLKVRLIVIMNTSSHFAISNCYITNGGRITIVEVTNGVISENQVSADANPPSIYIELSNQCQVLSNSILNSIYCEECKDILIENNTIVDLMLDLCNQTLIVRNRFRENGIYCYRGWSHLIENNTIIDSETAIDLYGVSNSIIRNNTMYRNQFCGICLSDTSENNSIYYNRIGCSGTATAYDEGISNLWDDNISTGNYWYDYSGSGVYEISGPAASVDRYPSIFIIDCDPPLMTYRTYNNSRAEGIPPLQSFTYEVSVEDSSGVDTVLFHYIVYQGGGGCTPPMLQWENIEMEYQPTIDDPNRYVYTVVGPLYGVSSGYYYSANDTLGNNARTEEDHIIYGPTQGFFESLAFAQDYIVIIVLLLSVISLAHLYTWRNKSLKLSIKLRTIYLKFILPVLTLFMPLGVTTIFTSASYSLSLFGAGWIFGIYRSNSGFEDGSYYGVLWGSSSNVSNSLLLISAPVFFIVQLSFLVMMNRYFEGKTTRRRTKLMGILCYLVPFLIMDLFALQSIFSNYIAFPLILPLPVLLIIGLITMKIFELTRNYDDIVLDDEKPINVKSY